MPHWWVLTWVVYGYSLTFSGTGRFIGDLHLAFLGFLGDPSKSVLGTAYPGAPTIPQMLFVAYQGTFAIITPALISGTFAERMRFPAFALLMLLWSTVIYIPVAHWVWGGGWIAAMGGLDFAGGTVVHISSGISALVTAIYLGHRFGHGHEPLSPHSLPMTVTGAGLLWFGWFGFNAGSAGAANELATTAFVNTNTAAAAAALAWMLVERLKGGRPTMLGAASGAVAGLAAVTQAAGYITPPVAILIGVLGGIVCYTAVSLKPKLGYDDALDVVGVHMVAGTLGAMFTGIFASKLINGSIMLEGGWQLFGVQTLAILAVYAYCGVGTLILLVVVNAICTVRADQDEELMGLDLAQHSERAYQLNTGEYLTYVPGREPKSASLPPAIPDRFTIELSGIDPDAISARWRTLCQDNGTPPTVEFNAVYPHLTTVRNRSFNFRSGDRQLAKRSLELLFLSVSPTVSARILETVEAGRN